MTRDKVINWPHAKGRAEATIEGTVPDDLYADVNLSRAYLSLLEAVAPLRPAWDGPICFECGQPEELAERADALRDPLTGGEA